MPELEELDIYFTLKKMLTHFSMGRDKLPDDLKQWQGFLDRVNASFFDFDQERYLLERSMALSSAEFLDIHAEFEEAEHIAHIGHCRYWAAQDRRTWSKEAYRIFGIDESNSPPRKADFYKLFYEEDRPNFVKLHESALISGQEYETTVRIYFQKDQSIRWIMTKAKPVLMQNLENPELPYKYNLNAILMDIDKQKKSEEELKKLNDQLLMLSRRAGMSEVAASVLHNIGNILNSANISLVMLQEKLTNHQYEKLKSIAIMLKEGIFKNPRYLTEDSKGKLIPSYLSHMAESLIEEHEKTIKEISSLENHMDHIKDIVLMQNEISGISSFKEKVSIAEICNQALQMSCGFGESHIIKIEKQFEFNEVIVIDKTKILQILVNLLRNAKDALMTNGIENEKIIRFIVKKSDKKNFFEIIVSDNGIGIEKEYLNQIFSMGFTTKITGHGFGLHTSANAANEMGGELKVESHGHNKGATFTLKLPITIE